MKLPQGVRSSDFQAALQQFREVVGADNIYTSADDVALYKDAFTPFFGEPERELEASAAVAPQSVEEVQRIVTIANRYKIPLYPISTGRNLGYGGSAPTYSGSVVVDLKRMNKILEVSDRGGYCVVEPGVSFFDLYRYFEDNNHAFLLATPEPGWGSPIGNALDHGVSNVRGDNFGAVCGMEVVLASGELLRTGMGAVPTSKLWQAYRYGYGPYIDGIFSQSNFGIVTKMGFWLVRRPQMRQGFAVISSKTDNLETLIVTIQKMRDEGLIFSSGAMCPIRSVNARTNGQQPRGIAEVDALLAKPGGGSSQEWDQLAQAKGIPAAMAFGAAQGPQKVVQATVEYAKEEFSKIPGVTFLAQPPVNFPLDPAKVAEDEKTSYGIPQLWGFNRLTVQEQNQGHYYFSPNFLPSADDMFRVNTVMRKVISDSGDTEMLQHWGWQGGFSFFPKCYTILIDFLVYADVQLNRRRRELFGKLVAVAAENGWAEYRAAPAFQQTVLDAYSFNNHILRRFSETIKDAIDPNGIIAPGRAGIWPRRFREKRA